MDLTSIMRSYLLILLVLLFCFDGVLCSLVAKRANLSSKRDAVGGIRAGDRFYFPGGFESHDYLPTSIVDIYNITSGEWEEPIYLSEPRGFVSTAVIGDNIYFVGGTRILNCALLYNMTLSVYERIGCGPTVRTPIQVSNHDSTVTVLGYFSADFFSTNTSEWYHYPNLTSWMQNIVGGITVVHENLVIGLGGVNVTTSAPLHDAWIFDTSTQEFTIFEDATVMDIVNYQFNFVVAHGRIVIYTNTTWFSHQFGTTEWLENSILAANRVAILPDVLFIFNGFGYFIYNWANGDLTWSDWKVLVETDRVFVFENQIVLVINNTLQIYEGGVWTVRSNAGVSAVAARWEDKYIFASPDFKIRIYFSSTKNFIVSTANLGSSVDTIIPFDANRVVFFMTNLSAITYYYDSDRLGNFTVVSMKGQARIGTDIIDFDSLRVWVNLGAFASVVSFGVQAPTKQSSDNFWQ